MDTTAQIEATLVELDTSELRRIERAIRRLYRERQERILYDDAYGTWTEDDQVSVVAEVFEEMDRQEDATRHGDC